jgi:hypothetical protein
MYLYEIYYINMLHPLLNRDDSAPDELTVTLPEVAFTAFECNLMEKWKAEVLLKKEQLREKRAQQRSRKKAAAGA